MQLRVVGGIWNTVCRSRGGQINPMITLLFIAGVLSSAAALGWHIFTNLRAEDGYEDELGFHYGSEPVRRSRG